MSRVVAVLFASLLLSTLPVGVSQVAPASPNDPIIIAMNITRAAVVDVPTASIVTVHNPSDAPQSVTVDWSYDDGRPLNDETPVSAYNEESQVVDANANWTFTLSFSPDEQHIGDTAILARVKSTMDTSSGPPPASRFPLFIAEPGIELHMDSASFPGLLDGGVGFVNFYVLNTGNANETPTVTVTNDPNFNLTVLANFSPLPPHGTGQGLVLVRPLTSNESINLTSTLTVNSTLDPTIRRSASLPALHVNATLPFLNASLAVTTLPPSQQVPPDGSRALDLQIANTGSVDDVYNVTATLSPNDVGIVAALGLAPPSANLSLPQNGSYVIGLHPNETASLHVIVSYDRSLGSGNATLSVLVRSANADLLAPRHPLEGAGVTRTTSIAPAAPEPALVAIDAPPDAYPTDDGYFHVVVANRGLRATLPSIVTIVIEDELAIAYTTNVTVPALSPGATDRLPFLAPLAALRGSFVIVGTLKPDANDIDAFAGDNMLSVPLHVRAPALVLTAPQEIAVTPGGKVTLLGGAQSFQLTNQGDQDETFDITLAADGAPWLDRSWSLSVPRGITVTLPLDADVPEVVGASAITATVHAELHGRPSYHDDANVSIVVDVARPPTITLDPLADGVARERFVIPVGLEDAIGVASAEARVRRPDGNVDAFPLERSQDGTWSMTYTPLAAGNFTVEVHALSVGDPPRSSTLAIPWTVRAPPYAGVQPVDFENGSRIGSTSLRFAEAENGTTRALYVDVGTGPQLTPPPYLVQAPFWRDGPHLVELNATSMDGVGWHSTLRVTLDRTPPTFSRPVVHSDSYGRLQLSVSVPGAARVTARIHTPTGPVDVPMTRTVTGDYGASVEAPPGWSSVEFLSVGTNGISSSVALSSSTDHPLPFGPWLVLAAAGLAAIVVRGRGKGWR